MSNSHVCCLGNRLFRMVVLKELILAKSLCLQQTHSGDHPCSFFMKQQESLSHVLWLLIHSCIIASQAANSFYGERLRDLFACVHRICASHDLSYWLESPHTSKTSTTGCC